MPGIVVMTVVPVIFASLLLQSTVLPSLYIALIVLALLQSAAAVRPAMVWKLACGMVGVTYCWLAYLVLKEAWLGQHDDRPDRLRFIVNFHVFTLLFAFIFRVVVFAVGRQR
jgi:hypothetical protein